MQDRIRDILQQQINMRGGGYGTHMGAVEAAATRKRRVEKELGMGDVANRKAAARSPWINFLKGVEAEYGIPYNEAMVDPGIRELYHESVGSGLLNKSQRSKAAKKGAKKNCWIKYEKDTGSKSSSGYKKFLKAKKCIPVKSKYVKSSRNTRSKSLQKLSKAELIALLQ